MNKMSIKKNDTVIVLSGKDKGKQGKVLEVMPKDRKVVIEGVNMVSDGTDNHLLLLDFSDTEMTGKLLETLLEEANITVNKNTVPGEKRSPFVTSGVRVGTPAITSRGLKEAHMGQIAAWIARIVREGEAAVPAVKAEVEAMMQHFPLYAE